MDVEGRDIIVVEDIVDSGRTLHYFMDYLLQQNPASVK
jgi:hypoxanthine phosphoribosyltransferase